MSLRDPVGRRAYHRRYQAAQRHHRKDIERAAGGGPAWRTRISDARLRIKKHGDVIEWNKNVLDSSYRYLPWTPLGRAGETQILRAWTSDGPYTDDFKLTP